MKKSGEIDCIGPSRVESSRVICAAKSSFTKLAPLRILV